MPFKKPIIGAHRSNLGINGMELEPEQGPQGTDSVLVRISVLGCPVYLASPLGIHIQPLR